jgi:hypothetical protein
MMRATTTSSAPRDNRASAARSANAQGGSGLLPVGSEGYNYELALTPLCGRPGQLFTATMRLKPKYGSAGVFMPFYADGSYDRGGGKIADPDGTLTYSWIARPLLGEGRLVTQARDADTGQYGTRVIAFQVVEAGKPC